MMISLLFYAILALIAFELFGRLVIILERFNLLGKFSKSTKSTDWVDNKKLDI